MKFFLLLFSITALLAWPFVNLLRLYLKARKIGLPIRITPIPSQNLIWLLTQKTIEPILRPIAFGPLRFFQYSSFSWPYTDRGRLHQRLGPALIIVSPAGIQISIADPQACEDLLTRRREFGKNPAFGKALNIFGPNLVTADGEVWQRHRRITAPPFNERISGMVWKESLAQAEPMLESWGRKGEEGIVTVNRDTMTVALHVLIAAGLGKSYAYDGGTTKLSDGHTLSYRDALKLLLGQLSWAIVAVSIKLPSAITPPKLKRMKAAAIEFKQYMKDMVKEEREEIKRRNEEKDNLMSVLLRAEASAGKQGLNDDEIFGNLFIYNIAGHDTTANTLAYTIVLLSTDMKWQEWVGEEIDNVFAGDQDWDYETVFPRLKRCLALMYETMRIYSPVLFVPRYTNLSTQSLQIDGRTYTIPPEVTLYANLASIHTSPEYWEDSLTFRPSRFLTEDETPIVPASGTYLPWATGPRVCPGKKFAQVEFVAVIAKLLRKYRVRPVLEKGETFELAKERILSVANDSDLFITLNMKRPEKVRVWFEERK